jgi:serine/threonine-protein kinase RsbW
MLIASNLQEAAQVQRRILEAVGSHHYTAPATFAIKLALDEGLNNAIQHGNGCDSSKCVEIVYEVTDAQTEITITDEGGGFCPEAVPDPTLDENLEKPCGRGLMLMQAYMDEVDFNAVGNRVHMVKRNR